MGWYIFNSTHNNMTKLLLLLADVPKPKLCMMPISIVSYVTIEYGGFCLSYDMTSEVVAGPEVVSRWPQVINFRSCHSLLAGFLTVSYTCVRMCAFVGQARILPVTPDYDNPCSGVVSRLSHRILWWNISDRKSPLFTIVLVSIKQRLHIQFVKRFGILFGPNIVPLWSKEVWENIWPKYI